ncbi:uncharacterized protein MONOS_2084 [Monocercomonoides exilis]|uniref:uncharacterized protein n=1 Tax=Monocercomonoides exilis TaxID=2049356 RepID=UPI0035599101|nr:hypothetical protein MONOS_2084 [Monocercomonoides exilis]|eukprot:MONOS_2084.1-p1 / transcript=MONOS_2084.1 / gene=MONOS_2084 / organism=Monocercomonoides_exilis_PA203 / gene_product=hypothetical protein EIN_408930 / transcript_product=hypothetical protein EIN_408930 / location=Mono_scaffold00041:4773-7286(+) / protein_length=837 / sequence_SO=supercontig / SO=protein_coding / is_pseudo=false
MQIASCKSGKLQPHIFAIDISGSTTGDFYYNHVNDIFTKNYQDSDVILFWNHTRKFVSEKEALGFFKAQRGGGGTTPSQIVQGLHEKVKNCEDYHLILITDGEVGTFEIDECDKLIKSYQMSFFFTTTYVISKYGTNVSVSCPFNRYNGSVVIEISDNTPHEQVAPSLQVSKEDQALLDHVDSISTFEELKQQYDAISRALVSRTLGTTGDKTLHNQFVAMQNRIAKTFSKSDSDASKQLLEALSRGNMEEAYKAGGTIVSEYMCPDSFASMIQTLIRLSDGGLRTTFNSKEINSTRASRAQAVATVEVSDTEILDPSSSSTPSGGKLTTFQCPVTYDDEIDPAIMICAPDEPLLVGKEKRLTDMLIDCPLNALHNEDFKKLLISHVDHPISLKALREAEELNRPITKSPLTRRPLAGFLPLGAHPSHAKAADWTLSKLVSGGKALGNKDLWFACIWLLVEEGELPFLEELKVHLREQMLWRLRNRTTAASLTGLVGFVTTPLRLDAAVFFTLCSAMFTHPPPPEADTLRAHIIHVEELMKLAQLASIPVPEEIVYFFKRTRVAMQLLSLSKRTSRQHVLSLAKGLVQKAVIINKENVKKELFDTHPDYQLPLVPLDGPADDEQIEKVLSMLPKHVKEIPLANVYHYLQMADPKLSAVDLQLPLIEKEPLAMPEPVVEWAHYEGKLPQLQHVPICPATLRPVYSFPGGDTWEDRFYRIIPKESSRILSTHKLFMLLCARLMRVPSVDEFILFAYAHVSRRANPSSVLMPYVKEYLESVIDDFRKIIGDDVNAAVNAFNATAAVDKRTVAEEAWVKEFADDLKETHSDEKASSSSQPS